MSKRNIVLKARQIGITETLPKVRAAVPPDGEIILESTPTGARGWLYEAWHRGLQPQPESNSFPKKDESW
jgi:hypothetical protein